jgi:hypothetical protein
MAVQHANRGIVKNNLQLYYNREYNGSFLGEATVNFFSVPIFALQKEGNHSSSFSTLTSNGIPDLIVSGNKQVYYAPEYYTLVATGAWVAETNRLLIYPKQGSGANSYIPNGTYNFSFYARSLSGNTALQYSFYGITPRSTATLTTKWQRFNGTFTINNGPLTLLEFGNLNAGSMVCQIACIQVESKSYTTPFTLPVLWTPNLVNVTSTSGNTTITRGGTNNNDWTQSRIFSSEGISGPCYVSFKASQVSSPIMIGLNSDPSTGINYTFLDYAWYVTWDAPSPNTPALIFENGTGITPSSNIYSTSTVFQIIYDGSNVNYYMDGVLKRSVARASTLPLYLDSSFYSVTGGGAINSLSFGPLSQINRFSNYKIGGGGLLDISGNNVNADLTNVSFNSTGYIFTGASSNRVQFTTPTSFIYSAAGKTVLMWVNYGTSSYVGFCGLGNAANGQSFNLRSTAAATAQFLGFMGYNADYDPSAGPQINNNVWHLIGATFDAYGAGNLKLYVDGVNIASTTLTLNTAPEASNIGYIGRSSHTGAEGYLTGQVGQFMIYNRALSADEILQTFNSQRKTYGV